MQKNNKLKQKYRKWLSFTSILTALSMATVGGLFLAINLNNSNLTQKTSLANENIITNSDESNIASNKQTRDISNTINLGEVNADGSVTLNTDYAPQNDYDRPGNLSVNIGEGKIAYVSNNNVLVVYDIYNNREVIHKQMNTNSIYDIYWDETRPNILVMLHKQDGHSNQISTVNLNTLNVVASHEVSSTDSRDVLYPIAGTRGAVMALRVNNSYGSDSNATKLNDLYAYQINWNADGSFSSTRELTRFTNTPDDLPYYYNVLAYGCAWANMGDGSNKNYIFVLTVDRGNSLTLVCYKNFSYVYHKHLISGNGDWNFQTADHLKRNVRLCIDTSFLNDTIEGFIPITYIGNCFAQNGLIYTRAWKDKNKNGGFDNGRTHLLSFNATNNDIDFNRIYTNDFKNYALFSSPWWNNGKNRGGMITTTSPENSRARIYENPTWTFNDTAFNGRMLQTEVINRLEGSEGRHRKISILPAQPFGNVTFNDTNTFNKPAIILNLDGSKKYRLISYNTKWPNDTGTGQYGTLAFATRQESSTINIPDVSNIKANDLEVVNNAINETSAQSSLINNFINHYSDTVITINEPDIDNYSDIYIGHLNTTLRLSKSIYEGYPYLQDSVWPGFTLTGFYKWTTDTIVESLDIPNEKATDDQFVTQYVKDNINNIFKDLPIDFDVNTNVVAVTLDTTNQLVGMNITLNKWIDQNGILQETNKNFTLDMVNFDTYVKNEYLDGQVSANDANVSSVLPQEMYLLANNSTTNNVLNNLKNYIANNFFKNTNSNEQVQIKDIIFGDFDNVNGTLVIKKVIITNYYDNGIFCAGDDFIKEIELNTTITGLTTATPTTIESELVLPEGTNYKLKNITDQQIVDLINNAADELVESKPNFSSLTDLNWNKENNFFVDTSSIVRDTTNNTISVNVATNSYYAEQNAVYTTSPYLTQTITISGFVPIETLATTINQAQLTLSVENTPLASLNVDYITGNEAELLQFIIDHDIFENLPDQFTIQNIVDVNISEYNNGSIIIDRITINKYLNETGAVVDGNKTFSGFDITLQGFSGPELEIGNSTSLNAPISGNTTIASDSLPSAIDQAQTKEALIALLNANRSKFDHLPETITTFDDANVLVVDQQANNQKGTLTINFTLSTLLINGQTVNITQADVNDISNDFIFSATLTGFSTLNLWEGLNLTIDFAGNNINDFVNNGELTHGFNYIAAIKANLITYLDTFGEQDTIDTLKEYINSDAFTDPSHFSVNYNYSNLQNSTIVVSDEQLDTLSGSSMWSNGVVFNVTNASYLTTNATLKSTYDPTNGGVNTLSQFKADIANVNINDVASFTNLPTNNFSTTNYSSPDLITLSVVNEKDNTAQLAITFKSYFDENGVINDYTLVFDKVFTFASEQDDQSVSLVDSVDAMDIGVDTYNSYQLVAALNGGNVSDINTWLDNNKASIVDTNISTENLTLTFDNAIVNNTNNNQVIITVCINNNQYQTFTITNLTPITSTNITVNSEIAPDVNASNINSYFDTDVNNKAKSFINWNTDSKLPFANDTVATVISAQVFNLILNSDGTYQVYINFIFNGVYLSINDNITYASNYLYQIMIDHLPATSSVSNSAAIIVATNNTDHFIDINKPSLPTTKNNNLPIILIATLLPIVLLILLCVIIYMFYVRHKNKK